MYAVKEEKLDLVQEGARGNARFGREGRGRAQRDEDPDVRLSKALSFALRHGAAKLGLELDADGFLYLDEILPLQQFRRYTQEDVLRVVKTNNKQRYAVRPHPVNGRLQIRANQGHSIPVPDLELIPITDCTELPYGAIHFTYLQHWPSIKSCGISRMNRVHIHMACGLPTEEITSETSWKRDLAIFIDLPKALSDGLQFYWSSNRYVLTPGDCNGIVAPKYFQKIMQLKPYLCELPLD